MTENINNEEVYSEVYEILNILGDEYISKIPPKLYKEFKEKRKKSYKPQIITPDGRIDDKKISTDAVAIFTFLNMKYFINDEEEKKRLVEILKKNSSLN
jgi:hypothetical protein